MRHLKIILPLIFIIVCIPLSAQQGMQFSELARKLDPYFAKELIMDIQKELPQGSEYTIWGWDVGDFSGDGYFDLGLTLKLTSDRKKNMQVYLFVDIDGYLVNIGKFNEKYHELPLELGIVIRNTTCYLTQKRKQFDWLIKGFTFDNGNLILLDEFTTMRTGKLTLETYTNYIELVNSVKYINTTNGEDKLSTKFLTIPSYKRGKPIYKGYFSEPFANDIDFVFKGAYYWKGKDDASFGIKSSWDNQYLYMTIDINDDEIVTTSCDTCISDHIELWIDIVPPYLESGDRFALSKKGNKIKFRTSADIGIYNFSIYPGDFLELKPRIDISSTDDLENFQKISARNVRVATSIKDGGFTLKFKIPFSTLGFEDCPVSESEKVELGCSIVYHDYDNKYRPEELTCVSTSIFSELNPSSYGALKFIPENEWYGITSNIYSDDILKFLMDNGY